MKKERNSFFSQYGMSSYSQGPFVYPNTNQGNMYPPNFQNEQNYNDLEARINNIEKELSRLDTRLTTLEKNQINSSTDYNFANSMYMV